jgi:hypothetical protein
MVFDHGLGLFARLAQQVINEQGLHRGAPGLSELAVARLGSLLLLMNFLTHSDPTRSSIVNQPY